MKCSKCAKCCEYYNGKITVSKEEFEKYKEMGRSDIIKFLKWDGKHYLAWYDEKGKKLARCPFLKDNKCMIHEIKPEMCKEFNCNERPGFLRLLYPKLNKCIKRRIK